MTPPSRLRSRAGQEAKRLAEDVGLTDNHSAAFRAGFMSAVDWMQSLNEALEIIRELLRVEGWRNCASGSEKRRTYLAAHNRANEYMRAASADALPPEPEGNP